MGKKTPLSPALGGGVARCDDAGGQLLRELEALSQVLYNAGGQPAGGGRPPRQESPSSPFMSGLPGPRRSSQEQPNLAPPLSPHLGGGRLYQAPPSPSTLRRLHSEEQPRAARSPGIVSLNSVPAASVVRPASTGKPPLVEPKSPLVVARRSVDKLPPKSPYVGHSRSTELTLSSAAAALRSQRPFSASVSQSVDPGKKVETYRLDDGAEPKPWHSQGFEKSLPEVDNFPLWLEDNVKFSQQLEAPKVKRSLWNWGPFKALSHIGAQRFNCMFTVHIHGIEGLPAVTNGLRLAVSWKRKELQAQSMPGRVFQGSVEFEESLYLKSTVYATKDGHKGLKFEPKCFDLAVVALDVDELVLGKHRLDLSRLLPKSVKEDSDDRSWSTSFKLAGKAKGGTLIVTFGCQLLNKNSEPTSSLSSARFSESPMVKPLRSYSSLPTSPDGASGAGLFSPAMSEMPVDGEYMKMEHLSLNDDYDNRSAAPWSSGKSSQKGDARPSFIVSPRKLSYSQQTATSEREDLAKALYDEDDGSEFNVVCQGHETSAIVDTGTATPVESLQWDDPKAEEDIVQGLSDSDVNEDLPAQPEDKKEQSESQVVEADSADELAPAGEGLVKDQFPVDPEVQQQSEISADIEEAKDGEIVEEWSVGAADDLDVLTKSWAVTKDIISREELSSDDVDGEDTSVDNGDVAIVESKDDEQTLVVENDEEEETSTLVVAEEMSTPAPQVKEDEGLEEDDYDLVTGEFLSFLRGGAVENAESGEDVPDSPRALLLQQFEQEALIEGGLELNFHLPEYAKFRVEGAQEKDELLSVPDNIDNILDFGNEDDVELAAILEAAEAELEKATQILKSRARAKLLEDEETKALMDEWGLNDKAFEEEPDMSLAIVPVASAPAPAPPLGNGLGPVMRIRDGGSLRSMSPTHFRAGGRLLLQASDPVVVGSSEMGATSMEILRRMAVAGMEGMAAQAMMAMPLEDLSGMALDQVLVEQRPAGLRSQNGYAAIGYGDTSTALVVRDNSIKRNASASSHDEHLRLEDVAPMAMLKIEALALEGLKIQAEMADQDAPYSVDPLAEAGFTVNSLNAWIRLDDEEKSRDKRRRDDTVTLSMLVQLRNPLRSNEPVGAPMMAVVQAERVRAPPHRSSRRGEENEEPPKFKIVDITVAGLDTSSSQTRKLEMWNKPKQLAAGSRWLVAHGMAKSSSSSMRNKPASKAQRGESLWSISARVHASGVKWRDSHIRNPSVIFADTSIHTY